MGSATHLSGALPGRATGIRTYELTYFRTHALPPAGVTDGARTRVSGVTIRRSVRLNYGLHVPGVLLRPAGTPRPTRGVALFHTRRDCERPAGPFLIRHPASADLLSFPGLAQTESPRPAAARGRGDEGRSRGGLVDAP